MLRDPEMRMMRWFFPDHLYTCFFSAWFCSFLLLWQTADVMYCIIMHHHCINILAHKVFVHTLPMTDWGGSRMGCDSPVKTVQRLLFFLIVAATNYRYIYCKPSQKMFKANFPKILRNWGTTWHHQVGMMVSATPKLPNSSGSVEIDFGEFTKFLGTNHLLEISPRATPVMATYSGYELQ